MLVRELRAILAKLPDDANILIKLDKTRISVGTLMYAGKHNMAVFHPDQHDVKVATDNILAAEIDDF